jgi:hypothetical protein
VLHAAFGLSSYNISLTVHCWERFQMKVTGLMRCMFFMYKLYILIIFKQIILLCSLIYVRDYFGLMRMRMAFTWFGEKPVPVPVRPPPVPQMSPYWMCGGQSGTGQVFLVSTSVFPCQYFSTNAAYSSLCTYHQQYIILAIDSVIK